MSSNTASPSSTESNENRTIYENLSSAFKGKIGIGHQSTLLLIALLQNDILPSIDNILQQSSKFGNNKTMKNIKQFFDLLYKSLGEIIQYKLDFVNQKLDIFKSKLQLNTEKEKIKADMYENFSKKIEQILTDEQRVDSAAMAAALRTRLTEGLRSTMKGGSSPQISHIKIFQSEFKKILIKLDNISEDISLSVSNKNKKIKKVIK